MPLGIISNTPNVAIFTDLQPFVPRSHSSAIYWPCISRPCLNYSSSFSAAMVGIRSYEGDDLWPDHRRVATHERGSYAERAWRWSPVRMAPNPIPSSSDSRGLAKVSLGCAFRVSPLTAVGTRTKNQFPSRLYKAPYPATWSANVGQRGQARAGASQPET